MVLSKRNGEKTLNERRSGRKTLLKEDREVRKEKKNKMELW